MYQSMYVIRNDICTTIFVQLSLSYSYYLLILSLPFSLSIVFDQREKRTTRLFQKLYQNSCLNIITTRMLCIGFICILHNP